MRYSILLINIFAILILLVAVAEAGLQLRNPAAHSLKTKCRACPEKGKAGDSRCKLMNDGIVTKKSSKSPCPSCGCQKCPDTKVYANSVSNYCKSTPSETCESKPAFHCLIFCGTDSRCTTLDFDRSQTGCACACQKCPDEQYYQGTTNYTSATPLNSEQQDKCPNVAHPVQVAQDLCS